MELIYNLALGLGTALSLQNLFYCFVGALIGTFIGVLPGIGPTATIAMLLPLTLPHAGRLLIMLAILRVAVRRFHHGDPDQPAGVSSR
jgi:TctA family transporter